MPDDPLGRGTPRSSVEHFFAAARARARLLEQAGDSGFHFVDLLRRVNFVETLPGVSSKHTYRSL